MAPVANRRTMEADRLDLVDRHGSRTTPRKPEQPAQRHQLLRLIVDQLVYSLNTS